ncbi:MAG: hypothetical protein IPL79_01100 [Myxococcales bacterium]|nr:hypothetical protein [Myxococcales bacterium]
MGLSVHESVDGYFHEVVCDALQAVDVTTSSPAEWYLVSLLGDFATQRITDEPLALRLAGTIYAPPVERVKALKEVGDTSLYVAGFFGDSLNKSLVGKDYYCGIGATAYRELSGRMDGTLTEVYDELSSKFPGFVEVLAEVRRRVDIASGDVVKIYERWIAQRDERAEQALRDMGVVLVTSNKRGGTGGDFE